MLIEELKKPLDRSKVSTRHQSGMDLSYIEGWWAISEANRIFGFDGWSRETLKCEQVCAYEYEGKNKTKMNKVGYEATVRITVTSEKIGNDIIRYGTGHGSGNARDLFDAIEGAAKEAETDAMKRALMTFGNPFGLALYDKTQANVAVIPQKVQTINEDQITKINDMLKESGADLAKFLEIGKVSSVEEIPATAYHKAVALLEKKIYEKGES